MLDINSIVGPGGAIAILIVSAIVFAESGLLVGFFLPGDSLLFAAGLAASQGNFSLWALIIAVILAAVVGDNVGYSIGRRAGKKMFTKKDGLIFRQEYIEKADVFYQKHGGKTIILARFTPLVRTFAPVVAGATKMPRQKFLAYNIIGGALWGAGMPLLGYYAGRKVPGLDHYMEVILLSIVGLSVLLAIGHLLKDAKTRNQLIAGLKNLISKLFLNKRIR